MFFLIIASSSLSCGKDHEEYPQIWSYIDFFSDAPFYYHFAPNSFIKDGLNRNAIASESIEDVELAARLGFRFIEANIWETLDGQFVCIHGTNGTFGPEVVSIDNGVITTGELQSTPINSVTLDWIKTYVRYGSDYPEYQTMIPSLEEFCRACKKHNIGILAGVSRKRKPVETCIKYLAENVVVYGPPDDIREYFKGHVLTWNNKSGTTIKSLLANAQRFGPPYICSLGSIVISELEERDELKELIEIMHDRGFLVGWASVYSREMESMRYFEAGMDVSGSGHEVNQFDTYYDKYDLDNLDHQPKTTGMISDGVIRMSSHDTVTCGAPDEISVGKGMLSIRFKGVIRIVFGSVGGHGDRFELKSEGDRILVFTDFFFNRSTTLTIYSLTDNTEISHFEYTTTVC